MIILFDEVSIFIRLVYFFCNIYLVILEYLLSFYCMWGIVLGKIDEKNNFLL